MAEELRMTAYYYGFTPAGVEAIDKILSAVACAGKSFHHTESWGDECDWPPHTGKTPVDWIQNAANEAAEVFKCRSSMTKCEWDTFSGATPIDKPLLLWFVGNNAPKAAHAVTIGQVSSYEPGKVWIAGCYRPIEWFTHWAPLPAGPRAVGETGDKNG